MTRLYCASSVQRFVHFPFQLCNSFCFLSPLDHLLKKKTTSSQTTFAEKMREKKYCGHFKTYEIGSCRLNTEITDENCIKPFCQTGMALCLLLLQNSQTFAFKHKELITSRGQTDPSSSVKYKDTSTAACVNKNFFGHMKCKLIIFVHIIETIT